ncbi:hypothetical protein RHGRI_038123 [Rhododendron griersonianum]|uniref:Glycosyltransferase n=1 Tax=Rhododendron griersonianum TaxID=479676 RepID=A0AAV6I011_9ERIC|nr:hypothetical protein RHGRI_038123 [Rhododendron griersonianum]
MAESKKETIVMFPFMGQGHIIPFLALSLQLEQRGFNIIFVNTPLNIKKLRQSIPPSSAIRLREIPFDSSGHPGLPPSAENFDVLPYPLVINGCGGFGLACYYSTWLNLPHLKTDSPEFSLPDFPEAGKFHVTQLAASYLAADGEDPWSIFQRENLSAWGFEKHRNLKKRGQGKGIYEEEVDGFRFIESSKSLKPHFTSLLHDLVHGGDRLLAVVADIFFGWSAEVAHELGLFHAIFSLSGGFALACYYSTLLNLPHRKTDSPEFSLPDFPEAGKIHVTQLGASIMAADGSDSWSIFQRENLPAWSKSDGLLINTIAEFDETGLAYFRRKLNRPVWAIGPILLPAQARSGKQHDISLEKFIKWLDSKPPNSVLYISFGSMNTISASQMMQLAKALEQSTNTNFIWVVRPPLGFDIRGEFRAEEWLPEGFAERVVETQNRGLVVSQWAPQLEILSHESVGAFLTQCGGNSVLESLSCGVPLIGWPLMAEQFFTAKFLVEEVGVCLEVARGSGSEVRCEDIVEKIEKVMMGMELRKRAGEVKEVIRNAVGSDEFMKGSSVKAMDDFLDAALLTKEKTELGSK